jgi:hypothetical protein
MAGKAQLGPTQASVVRAPAWLLAGPIAVALIAFRPASGQEAPQPSLATDAITVAVELASDLAPGQESRRTEVLDALAAELYQAELETQQAMRGLDVEPNLSCAGLIAAPTATPAGYLAAVRASYACFLGAQEKGDHAGTSEHFTAVGMYAELARASLLREVEGDEAKLAALADEPFANRRSLEDAAAFVERIEREGLPPPHIEYLRAGGLDDQAVERYRAELLSRPAEEVGISIAEFYRNLIEFRRGAADSLLELTDGGAAAVAMPRASTFLVGNPKDEARTVTLTLRRISIPADWDLLIEDMPGEEPNQSPRVRKVTAGYEVQLGPKEQIRVASVVVPRGIVERDTTARWAVEGRIGSELLGGIVHELYVPAVLSGLTLPPVGSASAPAKRVAMGDPGNRKRSAIVAAVVIAAVAVLAVLVLVLRRRRPSTSA